MKEISYKAEDAFDTEYGSAMRDYILTGGETALHRAYELGRAALDSGGSILDITGIHSETILGVLNSHGENQEKVINAASAFLSEFLSPMEMSMRGFMDAVTSLKKEMHERQRAEQALIQSERYYKSLTENALDIVTILDANGFQKYTSPSIQRVLGYSQNELIGKNLFEFIHPEDVDSVLEIFEKGKIVPGAIAMAEFRFRHKNGGWLIFDSVGKNLLDDPFVGGIVINSRDITDRRNLEESRHKYEFIANASKELMALINTARQFEGVNEACCAALSKNREEILGSNISEVLGTEVFEKVLKQYIDNCFAGIEAKYEGWLELPSRGKRYMEVDCYPYRDARSKITHVVIVMRDATKRKRTEDEIRKSQRQLTDAQRIAHIGSWEWSISYGKVSCSEEMRNILGLGDQYWEMNYTDFVDYVHPEDKQKTENAITEALAGPKPFIIEHRVVRSDESTRILQTKGEVILNERNVPARILATSQDITERELAQHAIIASEIRYRRLFETSREGLLLLEASTGMIVDVNLFMLEFLAYSRNEFIGKKLWELNAIRNIPESLKATKKILERDSVHFDELELATSDSVRKKVEFISITYPVEDSRIIQCHLWDITERRRLEKELNEATKQREEDLRSFARLTQQVQEEERRRISRELHDDICQRLTALNLHMNIFEDSVETGGKISLKRLRNVEQEIIDLITEVRRISYNLRPSAIDHFGLVAALRLLCTEFTRLHEIKISFSTNVPTQKRHNPELEIALYRIAQEALTNCVRHAKAKEAFVTVKEDDSALSLTITDYGGGFNPHDFFNRKEFGNHFGLMNMRERTELLGGTFTIESAVGKETTVSVVVPKDGTEEDGKN